MNSPKHLLITVVLFSILLFSAFIATSNLIENTVNALDSFTETTATVKSDNLLQYEWPQFQGDSSYTRFSAGLAPEEPNIMWKTNITGIQSYVSAFNGKVFVTTRTSVFALDKDTGDIVWNTTVPTLGRWPAVYKIDDTYLVAGNSSLNIETGQILWTSGNFNAGAANFAGGAYSVEEKMFYVKSRSYIQGWSFANPSRPPTLLWQTYVSGGGSYGSAVIYGDGKIFPGSFEPHQMALDARTGDILWDVETKGGALFAGSYYEGKFLRGCPFDNTFYCFNASNGEVLWTFNPGTHNGYWCSGSAAAYGLVYALNKDGHLYALDVDTGEVVWKYEGPGPLFFPGYPVIADGKVYATTGQRASYDPDKGTYSPSEFACLDAYTGALIWTLAIEAFPPRESIAVAYGNLYLIPAYIKELEMDDYDISDQVWAIGYSAEAWSMWRRDAAHSAVGQSGPTSQTLRWKFTTSGAVASSPSIADGRVYVGSQDKSVYCIDAQSGGLSWQFNTSARILSSPAVVDGRVYVGPDDGYVYCLDAINGSLIWMTFAGGYVEVNFAAAVNLRSSPTVVGNRVYVGSLDTKVYCLNADNGNIEWTYKTDGYITSSPAVVDGVVYIVSQEPTSGGLYWLSASNGALIRRIALPYEMKSRGTDMHASPAVAQGLVFAACNRRVYYGINATTGNITWTFRDDSADTFIVASPLYNEGKVFLVDQFFIVAVDAFNGNILWKSFLGTEFYVSPTYADGKLYVTSDQRGIYVLNATDGKKLSWFATSSNSWSSATLYGGKLYVGNNDWNVYCLSDYPELSSNVTLAVDTAKILLGDSVRFSGRLVPGMADAAISLFFVGPDGTVDDTQVVTTENGVFDFTYTPDTVGYLTIAAEWESTRSYYSSAYSEHVSVEVEPASTITPQPPPDELPTAYIIVITIAIALVAAPALYIYMKRAKKES